MKPKLGVTINYVDLHSHIRPAIITVVHHDEKTVDLAVFFPERLDFRHNVKLDSDKPHEVNTWHWPEN